MVYNPKSLLRMCRYKKNFVKREVTGGGGGSSCFLMLVSLCMKKDGRIDFTNSLNEDNVKSR